MRERLTLQPRVQPEVGPGWPGLESCQEDGAHFRRRAAKEEPYSISRRSLPCSLGVAYGYWNEESLRLKILTAFLPRK